MSPAKHIHEIGAWHNVVEKLDMVHGMCADRRFQTWSRAGALVRSLCCWLLLSCASNSCVKEGFKRLMSVLSTCEA